MEQGPAPALRIYADASWKRHQGMGRGSWGAAIVRQDGTHETLGGEFRQAVPSSYVAEFQAAANALHAACQVELVQSGEAVLLLTDCQSVVDALNGRRMKRTRTQDSILPSVEHIRRTIDAMDLQLRAEWVKGHCSADTLDARMNRLADATARQHNPHAETTRSRNKRQRQRRTELVTRSLVAHGIDVANAPLFERARALQLHTLEPGSGQARHLIDGMVARFPDADWSGLPTLGELDAKLQALGLDTLTPEIRKRAFRFHLHLAKPGTPHADVQLGRFKASLRDSSRARAHAGETRARVVTARLVTDHLPALNSAEWEGWTHGA